MQSNFINKKNRINKSKNGEANREVVTYTNKFKMVSISDCRNQQIRQDSRADTINTFINS